MSVQTSAAVWNLQLDPTTKLILLKLADYSDGDGRNAYPSVARIAVECCVSESTVRRTLARLRAAGILEVERSARHYRPTCYRIRAGAGVQIARTDLAPVTPLAPSGISPVRTDLAPVRTRDLTADTRSVRDPSIDPPRAPARGKVGLFAASQAAFTDIGGYASGEMRRDLISRLGAGLTFEAVQEACGQAARDGRATWPHVVGLLDAAVPA